MKDLFLYAPIVATKLKSLTHAYVKFRLKQLKAPYGHGMYIMLLKDNPNITQNQICEKLSFDKAHTSRVLNNFQEQGLVVNTVDCNDNRKHIFSLTDKGCEFASLIEKILKEWKDILKNNIPNSELATCRRCIKSVLDNATKKIKEVKSNV